MTCILCGLTDCVCVVPRVATIQTVTEFFDAPVRDDTPPAPTAGDTTWRTIATRVAWRCDGVSVILVGYSPTHAQVFRPWEGPTRLACGDLASAMAEVDARWPLA